MLILNAASQIFIVYICIHEKHTQIFSHDINCRYGEALREAFHTADVLLRTDPKSVASPSGCTAVFVLLTASKVICANAGDSRALISCSGSAVPLSFDHKPSNPIEYERITAAGGFVEGGRVNGNLALSRALADFEFKNQPHLSAEAQIVTCDPDIIERALENGDEFIVVACDGKLRYFLISFCFWKSSSFCTGW